MGGRSCVAAPIEREESRIKAKPGSTVGQTITCGFASAARQFSTATALLENNVGITYAELDARSNMLARYLRRLGVGPGQLVALLGGRSVSTITAILAVLKAGAAYVPLDDCYPTDLLGFMVKDCAPVRVLAESSHLKSSAIAANITNFDAAFAEAALGEQRAA